MYYDCSWPSLYVILNSLDRVVLTPILNTGNISDLFLCPRLLDKYKLTRAQIGPVEFGEQKIPYVKKKYSLRNDNFVSRGLQKASTKIGKIFTIYHRELVKKRPVLCTFCTQSAIPGLTRLFELTGLFEPKNKHLLSLFHSPVCLCVPVRAQKKATSAVL